MKNVMDCYDQSLLLMDEDKPNTDHDKLAASVLTYAFVS